MDKLSFEVFFSLSVDLMAVAHLDGYFRRVNPALAAACGYSETELLARPYLTFVHPEDVEATEAEIRKVASGIDTLHFVHRFSRKDGSWRLFDWTCPGLPPGTELMYVVARDITEQRARELERARLRQHVRKSLADDTQELKGVIPICSFCKNVRLPSGQWQDVEHYVAREYGLRFSGAYCPNCVQQHYPELIGPDGKPRSPEELF